jgi:hypothetical protein
MNDENDKLTGLDQFKSEFKNSLVEYKNKLETCYQDLLRIWNIRYQHEAYIRFEECIDKINRIFNNPDLEYEIRKSKHALIPKLEELNYKESTDKGNVVETLKEHLDYISILLAQSVNYVCDEIDKLHAQIKSCPFGQGENRSANASAFEKNMIALLQWIFIDDLELYDDNDVTERLLKRDGIFRISDNFDLSRCGLGGMNPKYLIVECKNYCKPSYRDLMQVFAYTIMSRITRTSDKPLCCIVSRKNPDNDSMAMKMRDQLYCDNETLIVFLSIEDLTKMKEMRRKGDPFSVLKEKIKIMEHINLKREC